MSGETSSPDNNDTVGASVAGGKNIVAPVQVDSARIILTGTVAWGIALVTLLIMWSWVQRHHHQQWIWTCVAGIGLGLAGLLLVRRHRSAGRTL